MRKERRLKEWEAYEGEIVSEDGNRRLSKLTR